MSKVRHSKRLSVPVRACCCFLVLCSCSNGILVKSAVIIGETKPNPQILVLLVESCKLLLSFILHRIELVFEKVGGAGQLEDSSLASALKKKSFLRNFLLFSVPGICYTVCNILPYFILEKMNVGTYVMATILKVPLTAILSKVVMQKELTSGQWFALAMLSSGSLLSMVDSSRGIRRPTGSMTACYLTLLNIFLSAFAAVWSEFMLKSTDQSIHAQNMQLYFHGIAANCLCWCVFETQNRSLGRMPTISDTAAVLSVGTMVSTGLLTSVVMKHADNIIRLFLSGASLCMTQLLASFIFGDKFGFQHGAGLIITLFSFYLYDSLGAVKARSRRPEKDGAVV